MLKFERTAILEQSESVNYSRRFTGPKPQRMPREASGPRIYVKSVKFNGGHYVDVRRSVWFIRKIPGHCLLGWSCPTVLIRQMPRLINCLRPADGTTRGLVWHVGHPSSKGRDKGGAKGSWECPTWVRKHGIWTAIVVLLKGRCLQSRRYCRAIFSMEFHPKASRRIIWLAWINDRRILS